MVEPITKGEASLPYLQILGPMSQGRGQSRRAGDAIPQPPPGSSNDDFLSPGVQHLLKGSLVDMEGDQGSRGVPKPTVGSTSPEEIGTLGTLPPPPPQALSIQIPRGFGITRLSPAPRKPQASVEPGDWPSITLISWLWRPQVPGLDGPRGQEG